MRTFFAITCSSTLPCDVLTVPVHLSEGHQREIESITKCHPSTHQLLESKKQLSESKNVRKRKQKAQEAKAPSRACGQETEAPTNSHKGTLTVLSSQEVSSNWAPPPTNEQLCPSPRGGLRGPQHNFKSVVSCRDSHQQRADPVQSANACGFSVCPPRRAEDHARTVSRVSLMNIAVVAASWPNMTQTSEMLIPCA